MPFYFSCCFAALVRYSITWVYHQFLSIQLLTDIGVVSILTIKKKNHKAIHVTTLTIWFPRTWVSLGCIPRNDISERSNSACLQLHYGLLIAFLLRWLHFSSSPAVPGAPHSFQPLGVLDFLKFYQRHVILFTVDDGFNFQREQFFITFVPSLSLSLYVLISFARIVSILFILKKWSFSFTVSYPIWNVSVQFCIILPRFIFLKKIYLPVMHILQLFDYLISHFPTRADTLCLHCFPFKT